MNCPSRTDETLEHPDWNQNPSPLNPDITTRNDFNGFANSKVHREHVSGLGGTPGEGTMVIESKIQQRSKTDPEKGKTAGEVVTAASGTCEQQPETDSGSPRRPLYKGISNFSISSCFQDVIRSIVKFSRFVGPGFLVAVAYIDPGNYSTDVAAGAQYQYALLFIVLVANLFAVYLQSLCVKLGTVTGLNLAENCKEHLPKWMVIILYIFSEAAIVATDIAEVIGSAIALNLLLNIPLVAGCAITLADVLFLLIFYRPNGAMWGLRLFEFFVMALVLGVVVCFCIQLALIKNQSVGHVLRGYVPSSAVVQSQGFASLHPITCVEVRSSLTESGNSLYQSCGILGATVMPHSLFLGSGVVQARLKDFDVTQGYVDASVPLGSNGGEVEYRPSFAAIRSCMKYSIIELTLSLFTFALFVNSAILIVAGASLYGKPGADEADLWEIHDLLSNSIAPAAGLIFALALLLSGISAGIVCTMAGQMVSEGMLNWSIRPWLRRVITRSISIIPSIIIAAAVGKKGLDKTLNASQVVLSVILPFVTAPLIYFTCRNRYMTVPTDRAAHGEGHPQPEGVGMRNNILVCILGVIIWLIIAVMNVALLVLIGMGKAS